MGKKCCYKETVPSKSDITPHFGINALCTGADTWSLTLCQSGLTRGLRCMKKPTEFSTHAWTSVLMCEAGGPDMDTFQQTLLAPIASLEENRVQNIKLTRH